MADVELTRDLSHIHRFPFESERGVARNDMQRRDLAQVSDDVLTDSVAEIFLFGIAAHVRERQDADGESLLFGRYFIG